ncbi:MAG: ATP-binding protein [Lysobacteraceae bacterium]
MIASSLYARIALVFAAIVLALGLALAGVGYAAAKRHQHETLQRMSLGLAGNIAKRPGLLDDTASGHALFDSLMAVNPNIEVYLLDPAGRVVGAGVRPARDRVDLRPVRALLAGAALPLEGENPRHRGEREIFSAAPIRDAAGRVRGYVYIVLLNDRYRDMIAHQWHSYVLRSALWIAAVAILLAIIVGLGAFALITRRLQRTIGRIEAFAAASLASEGARPAVAAGGDEIDRLGAAFDALRARLDAQMAELRRQDALRRELVANVSHDLRTPLTSMQGYLETLVRLDGELEAEERRRYLDVAVRQSRRVSRLSQQLFELARLECEDAQPQPERFSVSELVHDIVQKFALRAEAASMRIVADVPDGALHVCGDIGMIERAIGNLVDNALRHTPAQGEIRLRARPCGRGVEVRVEDTGPGIAPEHLPGLLERDSPLRRMAARRGGGLGLLIANRIVRLHGGEIRAVSRIGEGTSIGFVLPETQAA